jgi:hypothetical protein
MYEPTEANAFGTTERDDDEARTLGREAIIYNLFVLVGC